MQTHCKTCLGDLPVGQRRADRRSWWGLTVGQIERIEVGLSIHGYDHLRSVVLCWGTAWKQAEVELITCIKKRDVDDELKVDKKHDLKKIKGQSEITMVDTPN